MIQMEKQYSFLDGVGQIQNLTSHDIISFFICETSSDPFQSETSRVIFFIARMASAESGRKMGEHEYET